jgi:hypothetical protein
MMREAGGCLTAVMLALLCLTGCARFKTQKGVEARWRAPETPTFLRGVTTDAEVLEALGPPSQIINLHNGPAFYYLKEQGDGKALILILYNTTDYQVSYDRAVFFFNQAGVLQEYAYSSR